jgi:hypothetical protein
MNNLPVGLIAGSVVQSDQVPVDHIVRAILIGVDLGPNLSVTGSLATILWLTALRREDLTVGFGTFLKIGARGHAAGARLVDRDRITDPVNPNTEAMSCKISARPGSIPLSSSAACSRLGARQ